MAGMRTAVLVAVTTSGLAGLIHAVAAVEHQGDRALVWLFALCAVAQIAWAAAVAVRPTRLVLWAGIVLNGGAFAFWLASRTTGVAFVASLRQPETVGGQDAACAALALASVGAAVVVLRRPVPRYTLPLTWSITTGFAALLLFAPVLATGHTHTHTADHIHLAAGASHDHDGADAATHQHDPSAPDDGSGHVHDGAAGVEIAGHLHDVSGAGDSAHVHGDGTTSGGTHDHADGTTAGVHDHGDGTTDPSDPTAHEHPTDPSDPTAPHEHPTDPSGPIISLDDPRLSPAQRAAAQNLIDVTRAGMAAYPTVAAVEAGGYTSIGDGGSDGYEHYINWSYLSDGHELDPSHIEAIVVKKSSTGPKTVVSALYILSVGKTMYDVPDIAGSLTTWHYHNNLCFSGTTLVGLADANGNCAQGNLLITPPMLHVWMVDQPCGPFAGIDEHGVSCDAHQH